MSSLNLKSEQVTSRLILDLLSIKPRIIFAKSTLDTLNCDFFLQSSNLYLQETPDSVSQIHKNKRSFLMSDDDSLLLPLVHTEKLQGKNLEKCLSQGIQLLIQQGRKNKQDLVKPKQLKLSALYRMLLPKIAEKKIEPYYIYEAPFELKMNLIDQSSLRVNKPATDTCVHQLLLQVPSKLNQLKIYKPKSMLVPKYQNLVRLPVKYELVQTPCAIRMIIEKVGLRIPLLPTITLFQLTYKSQTRELSCKMMIRNQEILGEAFQSESKLAQIDIPRLLKRVKDPVDCRLPRYRPETQRLTCQKGNCRVALQIFYHAHYQQQDLSCAQEFTLKPIHDLRKIPMKQSLGDMDYISLYLEYYSILETSYLTSDPSDLVADEKQVLQSIPEAAETDAEQTSDEIDLKLIEDALLEVSEFKSLKKFKQKEDSFVQSSFFDEYEEVPRAWKNAQNRHSYNSYVVSEIKMEESSDQTDYKPKYEGVQSLQKPFNYKASKISVFSSSASYSKPNNHLNQVRQQLPNSQVAQSTMQSLLAKPKVTVSNLDYFKFKKSKK